MTESSIPPSFSPAQVELTPPNYFAPIDLVAVFGRSSPLEVDLGCGDGAFLVEWAARFPDRNFLGIERLFGRVRTACRKASRRGLMNVRVMCIETGYAVQYLLPPGSVETVHILFPDPWPKSKHKRRRIITSEFINLIHRVLTPGGRLRIVTDQEKYFAAIRNVIEQSPFVEEKWGEDFPPTTFEKHFLEQGVPIHRLELRKTS